ncbi:PREDICTED: NADH dehydrogenase [ubiquinone] 1 alpha subcomplex assembly factor 4-like [Branchiostoma belcheri]|uniref:NADH dehydrogenase [ubiquinone] 1 alpha subcomplex assembly factor 4 n=1 Tax=Branchiostoma belcheri TaxID=7741 RepID=A0A6P4Y4C1_BRABE|nr:PREDICTED: NADH dehydrogenase [ubiquinone] 1 alpha subcomplex assembly factor 4-like [Branchiostoma belcheri]
MGSKISKAPKAALRPMKNMNVEARAHRLLERDKPKPAPQYPSTKEEIARVQKLHPEIVKLQQTKDVRLDDFLKQVRVESHDPVPKTIEGDRTEALPDSSQISSSKRQVSSGDSLDVRVVTEGKMTVTQILEVLVRHKKDPEEWSAERVSQEFNLELEHAQGLLTYFKTFEVKAFGQIPEEIKKQINPGTKSAP